MTHTLGKCAVLPKRLDGRNLGEDLDPKYSDFVTAAVFMGGHFARTWRRLISTIVFNNICLS